MKKFLYLYVSFLVLGLSLFFIINSVFAWSLPTANPPQGDLPAPLDTSSVEQTKVGNLNLDNNLKVGGLLRLGLYTSHPTGTNGNLYYNTSDHKFYGYQNNEWKELGGGAGFWLASGNNIYNTNTGNVGIGTTAPSYKLDVSGGARISKSVHGLSVFNSAKYTTRTYAKIYSQPVPSLSTIGTAYFRININGHSRGEGRAIVELVISGRDFNVQAKVTGILEQKDIIVWHNTETSRYEVYLSTYGWTWPWEIIEITSDVSGGIIEPNPTPITTLPSGSLVYSLSGSTANLVLREGNVGIGTTNPGAKLEVAGQVKITGGSPGANKVLTSDASGLATWQAPSGLPSGSIIMYSGPWNFDDTGLGINTLLGWALCNGNNGTPNLSDKFVMGTTSSSSLGGTGGANSYSLTTAQLPSHNHSFTTDSAGSHSHSFTTNSAGSHSHSICISSAGSHTHSYYINPQQCCCGSSSSCQVKYGNTSTQTGSAGSHTHSASSGSAGDHSHSGTTNTTGSHGHSGTTASVGSGASIDNRPSFIQLAFIMRL